MKGVHSSIRSQILPSVVLRGKVREESLLKFVYGHNKTCNIYSITVIITALQSITRYYTVLQGITGYYRGLKGTGF